MGLKAGDFPSCHRFAHEAMATLFELFIRGGDRVYAAAAAREAFEELDRLELQLSRFVEFSDVARINRALPQTELVIGDAAYECLELAEEFRIETAGAFDVAVSGVQEGSRASQGPGVLRLDRSRRSVGVLGGPVSVDLGGIGKGYALDVLRELLLDWDIEGALIHGGHSTVLAVGEAPEAGGWPIVLESPGPRRQIALELRLSAGAVAGSGLRKGAHVIDPRTRRPVDGRICAWAAAPRAAHADALSTAFLVMAPEDLEPFEERFPRAAALTLSADGTVTVHDGGDAPVRFGPAL